MPQSLVKNYLHVVFSTKERRPWLQGSDLQRAVHAYLVGTCNNMESPSLIVGGVEDHVHILCMLSKKLAITTFIQELKRESSKWIKTQGAALTDFYWQNGYGAFSVSPSHVDLVKKYIATQQEHHRDITFREEFLRLLEKYHLSYDERYLWD